LLLNNSTEATLVFHVYSNLYFLVGYIEEDGIIVLIWYVTFFPAGILLPYIYLIFVIPFQSSMHTGISALLSRSY